MFRYTSFLISSILHLGLALLIIFWPQSAYTPPPMPSGPVIEGIVNLVGEGSPSAAKKPVEKPADTSKPKPLEKPQDTPEPLARPEHTKPQETAKTDPPVVKPVEKPVEKPIEKPVENPNAIKVPEKDKPKDKPTTNATAQQKPTQNANASTKPKGDPVKDALKDLQKTTGTGKPSGKASGKGTESVENALADLAKGLGSGGTGGDSSENGMGGTGVGAAYAAVIVSQVKPNWSLPSRADRRNMVAVVNLKIAPDGTIKDLTLITSSGDTFFDASVMKAIIATERLPNPPASLGGEINVHFTP